jgi:site-specific recombinase XerD
MVARLLAVNSKSETPHALAMRLRGGCGSNRGSVRCRFAEIKPSHVDDWVADMIEHRLSVSKITESLGVLRRVLDRVARDRAIATNPCSLRAVSLPKRFQTVRPVLSPAEVQTLAQAISHESDRVLVRLMAFGGLRINEYFALQ